MDVIHILKNKKNFAQRKEAHSAQKMRDNAKSTGYRRLSTDNEKKERSFLIFSA